MKRIFASGITEIFVSFALDVLSLNFKVNADNSNEKEKAEFIIIFY